MNNVSIMMIPQGFKIRTKEDIKTFIEQCMQKNTSYGLKVSKQLLVKLDKDEYNEISVAIKQGDLSDIFNPLVEIACTDRRDCYALSVEDAIWKYRKDINKQWFTGKDE